MNCGIFISTLFAPFLYDLFSDIWNCTTLAMICKSTVLPVSDTFDPGTM